ncbi:hypothetical protein [Streptomyces niveus]|uniref:hypothetical protein n=1 Tax=Streptomyces niveus TaxID=193462 RepID=UPI0036D26770
MATCNVTVPTGYTSLTAAGGARGYLFGAGYDFPDVFSSGFPGEGYNRTDMGEGVSGGPIFTTDAQIISANSHYESEDRVTRKNDDLFGSEHGDQAVAVINEINN